MDQAGTLTEFIFFHLPEAVEPENREDEAGQRLLNIFQQAKNLPVHVRSAWGRTEEDNAALVWVIEWSKNSPPIPLAPLRQVASSDPEPIQLRVYLNPSLSSIGGLLSSPIADITTVPFRTPQTSEDVALNLTALCGMNTAATQKVPSDLRPAYWCAPTPDSYPSLPHPDSPTDETSICVLVVGWLSSAQHYAIWDIPAMKEAIAPLRLRMLAYPKGLGMKHIAFNDI